MPGTGTPTAAETATCTSSTTETILILDDYHAIEAQAIHDSLTFLLDHLPPLLHLVIASRFDPPLPLARLRVRGSVLELRATDLRFTEQETTAFFTDVMALPLSVEEIAALEAHTEGWIAGLQLAALSMQGRDDVAGFIAAFTGSHRYVVDYLVEEVLSRQPQEVQDFLLQTCLLDRLSRPLCNALLAQGSAVRAQIELGRGNLTAAIHWADTSSLSAEDELSYPREREYLALVRVRIAQGRAHLGGLLLSDALALLGRLLEDAEAKGRVGSLLEILLLRALALDAQGNRAEALIALGHALSLAEPEGYVRLFIDEGAPVVALLHQAAAHGITSGYVAALLEACGEHTRTKRHVHVLHASALVEQLTQREYEVLRLLLDGASNREIAHRLVLSINTVKKHVYNFCGKLGVQSRTQAVARARTLPLLQES